MNILVTSVLSARFSEPKQAIHLPSGDQQGKRWPSPLVIRLGSPPSTGTVHICIGLPTVPAEITIDLPSGETQFPPAG
jgi:hypothetical protein